MAVHWMPHQREKIEGILQEFDLNSGECLQAAKQILPIGRERDVWAQIVKITPKGRARYVLPKVKLKEPWYYHFTTEVSVHYVDVLTGVDGTQSDEYREVHWQYPDGIDIKPL